MSPVTDVFHRPLRDLRISVTDRCNFRCPYCMPKEVFGPGYAFLRDSQLMTLEELGRIAGAFARLGVEKVRLTGGEPLMRPDLPDFVQRLKRDLRIPEVAVTTNGWMLEKMAAALADAGLDRINVSVDALDPEIAGRMNGQGFSTERVLRGIAAAESAGLKIKVNCVVRRGVNDSQIEPLAEYFRGRGIPLRFIEFMDVGTTNGWTAEQVVPAAEIRDRLSARWPIEPLAPAFRGEVAARYRYVDGSGEFGLISSVTEPFCRDCHRARLSADGKLYTCLFATQGADVLGRLRGGSDDAAIETFVRGLWQGRKDRYSDERAELAAKGERREKIEMSYIGG